MKKRNVISILLYLLGVVLFVIANSSVVSGSPIHLAYFQRVHSLRNSGLLHRSSSIHLSV